MIVKGRKSEEVKRSDRRNKSHDIIPLLRSNVHGTRKLGINVLFVKGKEFGSRK